MEESEPGSIARYNSEADLKNALGIETWRNLSKDTFFQFLQKMPQTDPQVALKLIGQIPEIVVLARATLDDASRAHEATLESNERGQEMVHQFHMERLALLRTELDRDLSDEQRLHVWNQIREVNANVLRSNTEHRQFLSEQFDKRLATAVAASAAILTIVVAAARSGNVPRLGRPFRS